MTRSVTKIPAQRLRTTALVVGVSRVCLPARTVMTTETTSMPVCLCWSSQSALRAAAMAAGSSGGGDPSMAAVSSSPAELRLTWATYRSNSAPEVGK